MKIISGIIQKPQKVVIYGPEGIGKSTFASDFPNPLFIDTEGSTNLMNVNRLEPPTSWPMLMALIKEVATTPGCCQTLVIDTMDWAERLCIAHICACANKAGIEDFGYGTGYVHVAEEMGRALNLLTDVIESGKNVVLTAHTLIRKFELPNEQGAFDRYELKLGGKTGARTAAMVKEWADIVLFANYKTFTVASDKEGKKVKAAGGQRMMYTTHHPNWDAKNRHDLAEELPFEYKYIAGCIPDISIKVLPTEPPKQEPKQEEVKPTSLAQQVADKQKEEARAKAAEVKEEPKPVKESPKPSHINPTLPKALIDLMLKDNVTEAEIQEVIAQKQYFPFDTPVAKYPIEFIEGVVIGAWKDLLEIVQQNREIPFNN